MSRMDASRGVAVPAGRWGRAARIGGMTGGILGTAALGGARALLSGRRPDARALLLTPGNLGRLTEELARMRGAAMKLGQLLSMETGDVLPPELAEVLARLRSEAHHMPPAQLKTVLTEAWGPGFLKRFARFDTRPVAAASIGQVHRARTRDGRDLALKIQYPGVRASISSDIANLGLLLTLPGLLPRDIAVAPFLDEARRQLRDEADYAREAAELAHFHALLEADPDLVVPRVAPDFCTETILAMDFVEAHPIEHAERADQGTRDRVASRLFELFLREVFDWARVQTDPNFANFRWQPETGRIVLLDFGAARSFDAGLIADLRALLREGLEGDAEAAFARLVSMGVLPRDAPAGQAALLRHMIARAIAVLRQDEIDFSDPTFLEEMRDYGARLGLEEGFRHLPPWDVLYLQRKLGGLVLLATRLGARVRFREMAERFG